MFNNTLLSVSFILSFHFLTAQEFILKPDRFDGKDAEIWSYQTGLTDGGIRESSNIYTWTRSGTIQKRSLIEFNMNGLPNPDLLLSATLNLFFNPLDQYESFHEHHGENDFFIKRITSSWGENTVWWENQPTTSDENTIQIPKGSSPFQDYLDIDVLPLIKDILNNPNGSFGLMMQMQNEEDPYRGCLFASSDHPNQELHPCLVLTFELNSSNDNFDSNIVSVYPNPLTRNTGRLLSVEIETRRKLSYDITDMLGKPVLAGVIDDSTKRIDASILNSGEYLLYIKHADSGRILTKKFVILD